MKFYFLKTIISFLFISMCISTNHMFINKVNVLLALRVPWNVCITLTRSSLFYAYLGKSFFFFSCSFGMIKLVIRLLYSRRPILGEQTEVKSD